ncbi:SDR family NAD(P)-dependent oxidoreductase [Rhodococcus sp. P1Y]|uniref:SDR family NAD(P)-dependent oxidoreductase n=1 Tax=Rhodococcus sp. P1Y TaxID=1302308 RepID=UPI000EB13034|nr:SDR family oxidoreductase [Rhodococcus sp. P1Y]AYJ50338.1 SDR family oxidoreductase [Rhodococcus sp. P1Y]
MFRLDGRTALVTGAGRGVGAEIALVLAQQGAHVAINDIDRGRAEDSVSRIEAAGGRAAAVVADVTDAGAVRAMVAQVAAELGPIDILVNNAGLPADGMRMLRFEESTPADWEAVLRINVYGVLQCSHAVLAGMRQRGWGRIVTISSDSGRTGEARMAVYAASKAAGAGFTRSLAKEVGPDGITCNTVSLGTIQPPGTATDDERLATHRRRYPTRRLGTPGDVAATVLWLASDTGSWITGQTIPVNGGYATS